MGLAVSLPVGPSRVEMMVDLDQKVRQEGGDSMLCQGTGYPWYMNTANFRFVLAAFSGQIFLHALLRSFQFQVHVCQVWERFMTGVMGG